MMKNQMIFQRILNEVERIRWEVERVEKNVLMAKIFAEEIFQNEREVIRRPYRNHPHENKSCISISNIHKISPEDRKFIFTTESMDLIFRPLVENNPYIFFVYFISKRGATRGYPWKDFSILPSGFDPTQQSFFFIADEKHNPQRKVKWTEPYLCPLSKTWMVTCSSPVWSDSNFIGVIGIDVNLGKIIEPLGQALKMTEKGYAFIISPRGNVIISSDEGMVSLREDRIWIEGRWRDLRWRKRILKRPSKNRSFPIETQISEIRLTSGKRYLLHTFLKTTGWSLVILFPKRTVRVFKEMIPLGEKEENPTLYQNNGVYLPLMSFVSAYSKSLQQMEKLIEGTKMIGKGALDHRIKVNRKDEIGLIAQSINKMAKELKKRKEEFESAYKKISQLDRLMALGRLTAGIAHEINNPLGVISNYVQVLLRNPSLGPEVKIDLMLVEEEIIAMLGIIKGLLNFSRESGMKKSLTSINEVLRKTVSLLKFQLNSQSIKFSENYQEGLPSVLGDPNHLQQVFLNILLNSVQSMPEGGKLQLKTSLEDGEGSRRSNDWILVEISDTGIGIESKYLDKIFDPFFTTKGWGAGTGLGLSIGYGIIKEHGGNIEVKSNPGEGTLVRTTLPVPTASS
jgi:signal transduction histidine kinase